MSSSMTGLKPQEFYLLERYGSAEYFEQMHRAWTGMLDVAEQALQAFMLNLPPDYRNRPASNQPDIVWGGRVLPNFRGVLGALDAGLVRIRNGDAHAIGLAHAVKSAIDAQAADYATDWMSEDLEKEFWNWQAEAGYRAFNLSITDYAGWTLGALTIRYHAVRGPLDAPETWPVYALDSAVSVVTGQVIPQDGVYLPDCIDGAAQFLLKGNEALRARVGYDPQTTHCRARVAAKWTLVRRISDNGGSRPGLDEQAATPPANLRCPAGQSCPRTGYWLTPAEPNSRRTFKQGETMPELGADYGATIWQWDVDQP
ncbi:hypothetical protein [Niveibacterium sp. SC-1]|uniref:hypothetical protein n=1 Tax=Niveibacterium sp. SC-1 TaxID=3135646 RepID=UPI00311DE6C5